MAEKKYYWLKLKKDFFKRHDIRVVEAMPNGKDYILFYLKLLCESLDHDGNLRFSERIPYNEEMLSTITNTDVDVVRSAIRVFAELDMVEVMDDGTLFMTEVQQMIGFETVWAEKKRVYREQLKTIKGQTEDNVLTLSDKSKSKEIDKDIDIDNTCSKREFEEQCQNEFAHLWEYYPRKQGRSNAYKSYLKARKEGAEFKDIQHGVHSYAEYVAKNKVEQRYIKHGSTWFNQRCWEDEYDDNGRNKVLDGEDSRPYADQEDDSWFFNRG